MKAALTVLFLAAAAWIGLDGYARYEGYGDLARWKDAVLAQCERKQAVISEHRYKSGHVVKEVR